ncbi:MAG: TIGR04283 family arsenosugar biosynthesis glycosyltransferase [Gammaproteobacteria bacterium]
MTTPAPRVSIIVPVLDEGEVLAPFLTGFAPWRAAGDELIVVDGGSVDDSVAVATPLCDRLVRAPRGRAAQMNAGAAVARGALLWFVHADSGVDVTLRPALVAAGGWGRFDVCIDDPAWLFRIIETLMNLRSRLTGITTGDQGIFVERALFDAVGGYPPLALMEDIELSRALRRHASPRCLEQHITTSARRWRRHGILRTVLLMWSLRLAWFCGVPAARLARWYGYR